MKKRKKSQQKKTKDGKCSVKKEGKEEGMNSTKNITNR